MKSKAKGDMAVGRAIAHYISQQCEVLLPIGDKQKYDLVVDCGQSFQKVQCKFTSHKAKSGAFIAPLRVMGGNQSYHTAKHYNKEDFDILFVMTEDGDIFTIPFEDIETKNSVTLSGKYEQYRVIT